MGVRYVVVPQPSRARARTAARCSTPSRDVAGALAEQVDFRQLDATTDLAVFENAAWVPMRVHADVGAGGERRARREGLPRRQRQRARRRHARRCATSGPTSTTAAPSPAIRRCCSPRRRRRTGTCGSNGHSASRADAFGYGSVYTVADGGKATLRYSTPILRWLSLLLEFGVWIVAVRAAWNFRRSTRGEVI